MAAVAAAPRRAPPTRHTLAHQLLTPGFLARSLLLCSMPSLAGCVESLQSADFRLLRLYPACTPCRSALASAAPGACCSASNFCTPHTMSSLQAKCQGCKETINKDELRMGVRKAGISRQAPPSRPHTFVAAYSSPAADQGCTGALTGGNLSNAPSTCVFHCGRYSQFSPSHRLS